MTLKVRKMRKYRPAEELGSSTTVRTIPSRLPVPTRSVSLLGESPEAVEEDTCLYSEVVSSRPASLRGESTVADPLLGSEVLTKPLLRLRTIQVFNLIVTDVQALALVQKTSKKYQSPLEVEQVCQVKGKFLRTS